MSSGHPSSPIPASHREWLVAGLRRGGTHWMVLGSAIGGVGAYAFQVVGTRSLGEVAYASIGVLWTIQYLLVSIVLVAAETYVTRQVVLRRRGLVRDVPYATLWAALGIVAVATAGLGWMWSDRLYGGTSQLALTSGVIALAYGALALSRGTFAGQGRFRAYGLVTGGESTIRLTLSVGVVALGATATAFAWVMPVGAALAAGWVLLPRRVPEEGDPAEELIETTAPVGQFLVVTTTVNAAAQMLLAGGPLLLPFLGADPDEVSVFFVTVTAARVPLVFALGGVLSRLLSTFTRLAAAGQHRTLWVAARVLGGSGVLLALLSAAAGAALGPPLVAAFFGPGFRPTTWLVAAAAASVVLATTALIVNQILVAMRSERDLLVPWLSGVAAAGAALALVEASPSGRVAVAMLAGQGVALVLLLVVTRQRTSARALRT